MLELPRISMLSKNLNKISYCATQAINRFKLKYIRQSVHTNNILCYWTKSTGREMNSKGRVIGVHRYSFLIMIVMLLSLGCGAGTEVSISSAPFFDVTADWSGTWSSNTGSRGDIILSLTQDGSNVSGTISIRGSPCFQNGNISGIVTRDNFMTQALFTNDAQVDFDGTVSDVDIRGTYDTINSVSCRDEAGTWAVTKKS
jgi:hypothetical protein